MQHDLENVRLLSQISLETPEKLIGDQFRIKAILHLLIMNSLFRLEEGNLTISCMIKQNKTENNLVSLNLPPISEAFQSVSLGQ